MTFDEFFAKTHKDAPGLDRNLNAKLRAVARQAQADCWNAAIDAAIEALRRTAPAGYPADLERLKV